jgi:hypothetical protein
MITIINPNLDKITLSRSFSSLTEFNKCLGKARYKRTIGDLHYPKFKVSKYQTIFVKQYPLDQKPCVYFKFGSTKKGSIAWVDFTPTKLDLDSWIDTVFTCVEIFWGDFFQEFRIQNIELDMDIKSPMEEFIFIAPKTRIENTYYQQKGSLYLGSKYSPNSFIIYDKQKQLYEKKHKVIPHSLTRIEARIRRVNLPMSQLSTLDNPFKSILVIPLKRLTNIPLHKATTVFLDAIHSGRTGQEAYQEQGKEGRRALLQALSQMALRLGHCKSWGLWLQHQYDLLYAPFS